MNMQEKSRSSLDGEIIHIRRGLVIYKIFASPYYILRYRDSRNKKNIIRSTKEKSRIQARKVAEEFADNLSHQSIVDKNYRFSHYADLVEKDALANIQRKAKRETHITDLRTAFYNKKRGLVDYFGHLDMREITTRDWTQFVRKVQEKEPNLSSTIHNHMRIYFRKVMITALMDGVIHSVPELPKLHKSKREARTYFRFHPIVSNKEQDEYRKLRRAAQDLAKKEVKVRGVPITEELYDIIIFLVNSFVRPSYSELYSLKHKDISIREKGDALDITIARGKTGSRKTSTMIGAVSVYKRCVERNPAHSPDDFIFLPQYKNRKTATRIIQRQFSYLLKEANLQYDYQTNIKHSMYSLRHTAIMMRLYNSQGEINTYLLAKMSGTSVKMMEDFYAKDLPPTDATVENLQTFGSKKKDKKYTN